jgi:hypothetical protein
MPLPDHTALADSCATGNEIPIQRPLVLGDYDLAAGDHSALDARRTSEGDQDGSVMWLWHAAQPTLRH